MTRDSDKSTREIPLATGPLPTAVSEGDSSDGTLDRVDQSKSLTTYLPKALEDFFFGRLNYERQSNVPYTERTYRLQPLRLLLERLGNPHCIPVVHVAGTKGKGSVATLIQRALVQAGYRVGLYTSPHVRCLTERFVVDRNQISVSDLALVVDELRPAVEAIDLLSQEDEHFGHLTFFDVCTAAAFVAFRQKETNLAVIEVGLGGRLDSTNVVCPLVSVITTISFDHTAQLGNTLAAIAREKAGIIKSGVPVVSGVLAAEAQQVIVEVADETGAELFQLGRDFAWQESQSQPIADGDVTRRGPDTTLAPTTVPFDLRFASSPDWDMDNLRPAMVGLHQRDNTSLAVAALRLLQKREWALTDDDIRQAVAETEVEGRIQIVSRHPLTILDAAHNPASFQALIDTIRQLHQPQVDRILADPSESETDIGSAPKRRLVFAVSKDKDFARLLELASGFFDEILFCKYVGNPRGVETGQLVKLWDQVTAELRQQDRLAFDSPHSAFQRGKAISQPDDVLVVAGSVFLLGEV